MPGYTAHGKPHRTYECSNCRVILGALSASSLLIGAALALWLRPSGRAVGLIMGFGSGTLVSALAYELVPEATKGDFPDALGLAVGALAFFAADWINDRRGGDLARASRPKTKPVPDWQTSWALCWMVSPRHWCLG